jgi:hypothetical protein
MIDFHRSSFQWLSNPWMPDPYYRYPGGFVGKAGEQYYVRFKLDGMTTIRDEASGQETELFIGAPCRFEYTIARRNLFQVPSAEFRLAFSRSLRLAIATRPSTEKETEQEVVSVAPLREAFREHKIELRKFAGVTELGDSRAVSAATLAGDLLNARSTYRDQERGLTITVEYPVNLINLNADHSEFQVCTGPVIVPDLTTWDGSEVQRVFLAHVAFTEFDHVEFILRREVEAAPAEREWLDTPRGLDRLELIDPAHKPPNYPPLRPRPTTYNEVWEFPAHNVLLRAENS